MGVEWSGVEWSRPPGGGGIVCGERGVGKPGIGSGGKGTLS